MARVSMVVLAAICGVTLWSADPGTATRGQELFEKRCGGCHALDTAKVGPPLRGVVGRRGAADA